LSFRESLRIAAANSIDSTVVLKQLGELSVVYDIEPRLFVSAAQRTFARRGVIWQADGEPEMKMSDVGSRAELISSLDAAFGPHLESVCNRSAQALAASGFSGLLVHSGSPQMIFEDDQPYSFQVNAPFKVWVPVCDVPDSFIYFQPGSRPQLLFHSPPDYWHKPARTATNVLDATFRHRRRR
jgi:hypothetical protein